SRCAGGSVTDAARSRRRTAAPVRELPQQREQAIDDRELRLEIVDPAPGCSDLQRGLHFVCAAVRRLVARALVAGGAACAFAEVQRDAARGTSELVGKVLVVLLDRGDDVAKAANELERNFVGDK